jgi:hypothetical protein
MFGVLNTSSAWPSVSLLARGENLDRKFSNLLVTSLPLTSQFY